MDLIKSFGRRSNHLVADAMNDTQLREKLETALTRCSAMGRPTGEGLVAAALSCVAAWPEVAQCNPISTEIEAARASTRTVLRGLWATSSGILSATKEHCCWLVWAWRSGGRHLVLHHRPTECCADRAKNRVCGWVGVHPTRAETAAAPGPVW